MSEEQKNPYKKGDVIRVACVVGVPQQVVIDVRVVKSTFGPDMINLDQRTSDLRSRVGIKEVGATDEEALRLLADRLDGLVETFITQTKTYQTRLNLVVDAIAKIGGSR